MKNMAKGRKKKHVGVVSPVGSINVVWFPRLDKGLLGKQTNKKHKTWTGSKKKM